MKYHEKGSLDLQTQDVSVPLRGYGFEIDTYSVVDLEDLGVSVPLRGYGFEIVGFIPDNTVISKMFPSPYGDMVLKFFAVYDDAGRLVDRNHIR